MIPLAATTGFYVYYLIQNQNWKTWEKSIVKFSFGLIGFVGILVPILLFVVLKSEFGFYSIAFSVSSIAIGIYLFIQIFKEFNIRNAFLGMVAFVSAAMLLGIPVIDSIFNNNPNHKSILTQKEMIENSGLKLYGFDAYSPEIWFKYGEIIPEIYPEKPETFPREKEFFLISMKNEEIEGIQNQLAEMGFRAELIEEFDDNEEKPGTKNDVDRKKMMLFKVNKF